MQAVPPPPPREPWYKSQVTRMRVLYTVLAAVASGALSFFMNMAAISAQISSYSTDDEVTEQIRLHNVQPRAHGSDWSRSPHPDYAESAAKTDQIAMDIGNLIAAQKKDAVASFKMLGSMQVADCERNAKLKAQRANKFRADYDALVDEQTPAREAADQLVREACPWMSR